jgi:hypothetical protein
MRRNYMLSMDEKGWQLLQGLKYWTSGAEADVVVYVKATGAPKP